MFATNNNVPQHIFAHYELSQVVDKKQAIETKKKNAIEKKLAYHDAFEFEAIHLGKGEYIPIHLYGNMRIRSRQEVTKHEEELVNSVWKVCFKEELILDSAHLSLSKYDLLIHKIAIKRLLDDSLEMNFHCQGIVEKIQGYEGPNEQMFESFRKYLQSQQIRFSLGGNWDAPSFVISEQSSLTKIVGILATEGYLDISVRDLVPTDSFFIAAQTLVSKNSKYQILSIAEGHIAFDTPTMRLEIERETKDREGWKKFDEEQLNRYMPLEERLKIENSAEYASWKNKFEKVRKEYNFNVEKNELYEKFFGKTDLEDPSLSTVGRGTEKEYYEALDKLREKYWGGEDNDVSKIPLILPQGSFAPHII